MCTKSVCTLSVFTPVEQGNTVAHSAAAGGKGECFNCIVQHGANLTITNAVEETPLDAAKKAGHPLLMEKAGWSVSDILLHKNMEQLLPLRKGCYYCQRL